jgi:hypothetical protein
MSVSSFWADERLYWPLAFEPYTPAHHFAAGKADPKFRTKLEMAAQLVERALADRIRFRAVVAYQLLRRRRRLQAVFEGVKCGLRAGFEALACLVAQRG